VSLVECEVEATGVSDSAEEIFVEGRSPNSPASLAFSDPSNRDVEFPGVEFWFACDPEVWLND
jgi:hypothetical protein